MSDRPPLHDFAASRAVLIGAWKYQHLTPLAASEYSVERMTGLLTGPLCGWPNGRVSVLTNPSDSGNLPDKLITLFEDITGVALFYFVGHGQMAEADHGTELCLGLVGSRREANRRASTSLPLRAVRDALRHSPAATKIVILDCCYAGLATLPDNALASEADLLLDSAAVAGTYTMAATGVDTAMYELDTARPQTYFTKALADTVEVGIPGQAGTLTLRTLFKHVRESLFENGRPIPRERTVDAAGEFVFAYNAALPSRPPLLESADEQTTRSSPLYLAAQALAEPSEFFGSLGLTGEDQTAILAQAAGDLIAPKSTTGDGKFIDVCFAAWAEDPASLWEPEHDPMDQMMHDSVEASFPPLWRRGKNMTGRAVHYVSLGSRDGVSDTMILRTLQDGGAALSYMPVGVNAATLRTCFHEPLRHRFISHDLILPIQLDFSDPSNLDALKSLLSDLVANTPILYSLLGNALSSFRDYQMQLAHLSQLLRPQDRFVLELATTRALGQEEVEAAAAEYRRSTAFRTFATSALLNYTDIPFDMDSVYLDANVEDGRTIQIKVIYRNQTGTNIKFSLANRHLFTFPAGDTIRLHMTRKHLRSGLDELIRASGMVQVAAEQQDFDDQASAPFGMDLMLLKRAERGHVGSVIEALWPRR